MSKNPTAVREVLEAILKMSRKPVSPEAAEGLRARLLQEPSAEMTDEELETLAKAESLRLEEAESLLAIARKKFPHANFDDIAAVLRKLKSLRETDPQAVDLLLPEAMERYWKRIDHLKCYPALSQKLKELTAAVGADIAAYKRDVHKALADSAARLKLDDQEPDPTAVEALQDLADAAVAAAERWRDELAELRKTLEEDATQLSDEMITAAAEGARQEREPLQAALQDRLQKLTAATAALRQVQEVRLTDVDEFRLANRFKGEKSKVSEKLAKAYCAELGIAPEGKWRNVLDYLEALKNAGDNKTAQARASRQKPSAALAAFLQLAEPAAWGSHGAFVRERANDFDGRHDKAAAVLRALAAIGTADRSVNQWLVRLALNGTPVDTLARYHAAQADLAGVSVPSTYSAKLDELMATPTFDATVWTRLKGWAATKYLFLSSVLAYLKTGDETIARRVAEDYYGLVATTRPGNTEEGRIATGLSANVIEQSKQRTVHTTATSSGHAYKYHYIGGFVRAAWELHVHEGKPNLHPAWKTTSNPRERVDGRDSYVINGALRALLS